MKLECRDAQRMVPDYLAKKLDDKECAAFLSHVKSCPRCMEELETSFMIDYFLRYLDEDTDRSFDIRRLLKENIRKSELRIRRHRLPLRQPKARSSIRQPEADIDTDFTRSRK